MVKRSDLDKHTASVVGISNIGEAELSRLYTHGEGGGRDRAFLVYPRLADGAARVAQREAKVWFEQLRAEAEAAGRVVVPPAVTSETLKPVHSMGTLVGDVKRVFDLADQRGVDATDDFVLSQLKPMLRGRVWSAARGQMVRLVEAEGKKSRVRFARVPQGPTCAWCIMLASRGWVYFSEETAGEYTKYHKDCNCLIVPSWDAITPRIHGYDPEYYYLLYQEARRSGAGGLTPAREANVSATLHRMRRRYAYAPVPAFSSSGAAMRPRGGFLITDAVRSKNNPPPKVLEAWDPITKQCIRGKPLDILCARSDIFRPGKAGEIKRDKQLSDRLLGLLDRGRVDVSGALNDPQGVDVHEILTAHRLARLGEDVKMLSRSDGDTVTSADIDWLSRGGLWEVKTAGAKYDKIAVHIKRAVKKASARGEHTKENFLIDLGLASLSEKLAGQLGEYNCRTTGEPIKRLMVLSEDGKKLTEIKLK